MAATDLLIDGFGRVRDEVHAVLTGLADAAVTWRPDPQANSIGWLVWHLSRVQDDHLAAAFDQAQVWTSQDWPARLGLPFDALETGYGHSATRVGQVRATAEGLLGYHDGVYRQSKQLLCGVTEADLGAIVDEQWDPPVTLAVRLVSVLSDDLQHVGQAAYLRGLSERR